MSPSQHLPAINDSILNLPLAPEQPAAPSRRPNKTVGVVALVLVGAMAGLLAWYVVSDRGAPYSAVGAVSAFTTQVAPRVAGAVVSVPVVDNQLVKAGDVLFELDPRPFEIALRQAEASLLQAKQGAGATTVSLEGAQARVDQARNNLNLAESAIERTRTMFGRGLVSQAQMDKAEGDLLSTRSAVQMAQADYDSALLRNGDDVNANAQVELAQAQLDQTHLNLEFATVRAPDAGVITNLKLGAGQFIGAGTPAMTFIASTTPWIMADLREGQLVNVTPGDAVSVLFDGQPGRIFDGKVQGIAWGIDPGRTSANGLPQNQASARWFEPARTIPVHIVLDDPATEWPDNVRVGSKVSVVIYAAAENGPVAWIAGGLQRLQAYLSYLY